MDAREYTFDNKHRSKGNTLEPVNEKPVKGIRFSESQPARSNEQR